MPHTPILTTIHDGNELPTYMVAQADKIVH